MFHIKDFKFILLTLSLNLVVILFIYRSVFSLDLQGDSWHYGWHHQIYYGSNVFSQESLKGMRSSLGGASLTFGLIQNNFGLNAKVFYTISVILKFLTVVAFFFLVRKLTNNNFASLLASLILSVTFTGVEATHWVFNMYAYIGLIFITLSLIAGLDLPENFILKKWLVAFVFACVGVWYAAMRTSAIIPLIIVWSIYKFITLRSKSSLKNLLFWIIGFAVFIIIDKFLLGQMETDYSRYYIIGQGLQAFQTQITSNKFDFLLSPATNLGTVILPDITWYSLNFPKLFSFLGTSTFSTVVVPSLFIFSLISWVLSTLFNKEKEAGFWITPRFINIFFWGLLWTLTVFLISQLGPANFPSWVILIWALFGGYFMILCLFLLFMKQVQPNLKDLFFFSFLWFFVFLLLPLFQNGGAMFGTYHRYMVTTAPSVPLFMAGLLMLVYSYKNKLARILVLLIVFFMIFNHGLQTKSFFDRKAAVHNRQLTEKIWQQFSEIVPAKVEYKDKPPTFFYLSADNPIDQATLFEALAFGFDYRVSLKYGWDPHLMLGLYNQNYQDLLKDVKKNPKLLDEFYAVLLTNQSLTDVTKEVKEKIAADL